MAATVTTCGSEAGDSRQALRFELPAATATATPWLISPRAAASRAGIRELVDSDMFTTAGDWWWEATQSRPARNSDVEPEPEQSSTRMACTVARLAMPQRVPATVLATWVPWPLQSPQAAGFGPDSRPPTKLRPAPTRPESS